MKHLVTTYILLIYSLHAFGQEFHYTIDISKDGIQTERSLKGAADSLKLFKLVTKEHLKLLRNGYLLSNYKIEWSDSVKRRAEIITGSKFRWGSFDVSEVPETFLSKAGFRKSQFQGGLVSAGQLGSLLSGIIKGSEMAGYPFAKTRLDSVLIENETISARIRYNSGPRITYDTLILSPGNLVKSKFMASYLGVRKGDVFNSNTVEKIPKRLKELSYCRLEAQPMVRFENKGCKINLTIKPVKANTLDALIGLAPNQNNKLLATGYVNLDLNNLFKSGKQLYFSWRQFAQQSQKLSAFYDHTNLFGSVINVKGTFDLLKQDTTFINRDISLHIGYTHASQGLNVTSRYLVSRVLSDISSIYSSNPQIDFDAQYYGVEIFKNEFDNKINPTKGWRFASDLSIGAKKIRRTGFVPAEVYDSLNEQMFQGIVHVVGEGVLLLTKLFVLFGHIEAASLNSNGALFGNDLFRIGGINSIRGFNELEIYSSAYVLAQLEGRVLLGPSSRLFAFVDWASTENKVLGDTNTNYLGLGSGILLETKAGVVQLVFAVGKSPQQSLSLTESKIHVGYVAKF
ncbi:MAG: BamA/TamA family outer membrane protein [Cyclobacteriaceae bacterium]|nr:BamA/TamA family outer membrane protein [Cyclobacteriaceae bacterium]